MQLTFTFINVSEPLDTEDFASEPSFTAIGISGICSPDVNRTDVEVMLNATAVSVSEGKLRADILKSRVESFFNITLLYYGNFTFGNTIFYYYRLDECPIIQKFRDIFLEHKPSQGFGKTLTPALLRGYVAIHFLLKQEKDGLLWIVMATVSYPEYFVKKIGQEYTVSFKELTGYPGNIQSLTNALNSTVSISISQVD